MDNNLQVPETGYNDAIKEIDNIIREMQNENCDIDKLAENTRRAAALIEMCQKKLTRTEEEIQKILQSIENKEL